MFDVLVVVSLGLVAAVLVWAIAAVKRHGH
jgi:hypothetical protein